MSNINDLRKQSAEIVGLCKKAQKEDSDALIKVVKIFNPSLNYLASLYAKSKREKSYLKIAGMLELSRVASSEIDEENFVTSANDAIVSRITTAATEYSEEEQEDFVDFVDQEDFVETPEEGKDPSFDTMKRTQVSFERLKSLVRRLYESQDPVTKEFGDKAAEAEFFQNVFSRVYAYLSKRMSDTHVAEDLAQDILIKILNMMRTEDEKIKLDPEKGVAALINRVAQLSLIDYFRKIRAKKRGKEVQIVPGEESQDPFAQTDDESASSPASAGGEELLAPSESQGSDFNDKKHIAEIAWIMSKIPPLTAFALYLKVQGHKLQGIVDLLSENKNGEFDDLLATEPGQKISVSSLQNRMERARNMIQDHMRIVNESRGFYASSKGLKKFASILRENLRFAEAKEPEVWEEVEDKSLERNREESALDATAYATLEGMLNDYRKDKNINVISDKYLEPARTEEGWEPLTEGRLNEDKAKTGTPLRNEEAWGENIRPIDKQKNEREEQVKKETFNLKMYEQNMKTPNKKRILDKDIGVQLDLAKTTILDQVPDGFEPFLSKAFNMKKHKVASSPKLVKKMIQSDLKNVIELDRKIISIASMGHDRELTKDEMQQIDELKKAKTIAIGMENEKVNAVAARYYLEKLAVSDEDVQEEISEEEETHKDVSQYAKDLASLYIDSEFFEVPQRVEKEPAREFYRNHPEVLSSIATIYLSLLIDPNSLYRRKRTASA